MNILVLGLILSIFLIILIMPLNFWICKKLNLIDKPNKRKVHKDMKFRGGGISLYIGVVIFSIGIYIIYGYQEVFAILVSATILFITGILDDKYSLNPKVKLFLQFLSASSVFFLGINIPKMDTFGLEFNEITSYFITVFWIVLLINAINLIDGLDGLASGVGIIILSVLAISADDMFTSLLSIIVIGMLIGFLKYNFFPSKIFLGDTGSMFIGLMIGILSITGTTKTAVSVTTILLLVSFPLLDMCLAIIRRALNKQSIFSPDKSHIHHCFMNKGFTHRNTVLLIYLTNIIFAILSYFSIILIENKLASLLLIFTFILISFLLIKYLNVLNLKPKLKH